MNEEKLRKAIAIACGWKCDNKGGWKRWYHPEGRSFGNSPSGLPRYLSERDAAIEAVIELCDTEEKWSKFFQQMMLVTKSGIHANPIANWIPVYKAEPLQICTALAKALNLPINQEDK